MVRQNCVVLSTWHPHNFLVLSPVIPVNSPTVVLILRNKEISNLKKCCAFEEITNNFYLFLSITQNKIQDGFGCV